jgi:hypothetical protein
MRQHLRKQHRRSRGPSTITVDALVPNPGFDHELLPDTILGIALDQRAFGPRKLMVAFAAYDGRFLALTYAPRTDPVQTAIEGSLRYFDTYVRGGQVDVAAVVLCDEPVTDGPTPPEFIDKFELARTIARRHNVHLVDWIGCDDDLFRCARRSTFTPVADPDWWDVPDRPGGS